MLNMIILLHNSQLYYNGVSLFLKICFNDKLHGDHRLLGPTVFECLKINHSSRHL